jgi:hypothetical protein
LPSDNKGRALALTRFAEVDYVVDAVIQGVRCGHQPDPQPTVLRSKVEALAAQFKFFDTYLQNSVCTNELARLPLTFI